MSRVARIAGVLLASLMLTGCFSASVRDYVRDNYQRAEREDQSEQGSQVFTSSEPPSRVAAKIADKRKPGDRGVTVSVVFLRYAKDVVAVLPDGKGGSRILIDDERRGYTHFYPFVGGWWGTYSGPGESFRGGGPGSGK